MTDSIYDFLHRYDAMYGHDPGQTKIVKERRAHSLAAYSVL